MLLERHKRKYKIQKDLIIDEKSKELYELKSRIFANVTHELRTPLTLILTLLDKILFQLPESEHTKLLRVVKENAGNLEHIVNQLLELSQLEMGQMKLNLKRIHVNRLLNVLALSYSDKAKMNHINYYIKLCDDNVWAFLDENVFEKIIIILLSNAFESTPIGGKVEILLTCDNISDGQFKQIEDKYFIISIKDTGHGLSGRKINVLMNRYDRLQSGSDYEHESVGIGLTLARELIQLHNGKLEVESTLGEGNCFVVYLPLSDVTPSKSEGITSVINDDINTYAENHMDVIPDETSIQYSVKEKLPKLLIVEDNAVLRNHISMGLIGEYEVLEADNGKKGLFLAENQMPDVIISDIMMPKMDGIEFCRALKSDWRTSHIPIILLTAKSSIENKLEGLEVGADDYITKPFHSQELNVRLRNLIEQRKQLKNRFIKEGLLHPSEIVTSSIDEQFINKMRMLIEEKMSRSDFTVELLAKEMGMSRQHLNRKIKAVTNASAQDWIRIMRLQRASQLLAGFTGNVSEIAFEVGFENPSYFTETFRKQFGCTPSEYMKSAQS